MPTMGFASETSVVYDDLLQKLPRFLGCDGPTDLDIARRTYDATMRKLEGMMDTLSGRESQMNFSSSSGRRILYELTEAYLQSQKAFYVRLKAGYQPFEDGLPQYQALTRRLEATTIYGTERTFGQYVANPIVEEEVNAIFQRLDQSKRAVEQMKQEEMAAENRRLLYEAKNKLQIENPEKYIEIGQRISEDPMLKFQQRMAAKANVDRSIRMREDQLWSVELATIGYWTGATGRHLDV